MDNIDQNAGGGLLARNVAGGRRFILQLKGPWPAGIAVALGGWERCSPRYMVERVGYPFAVLEIVTGGRGEARVGGRRLPLSAGVCFAVPPELPCRISTDPSRPLEKYFLALAGESVARSLASCGLKAGRSRKLMALGEFREIAELIIREAPGPGVRARQICSHLASALLEKIAGQPRAVGAAGQGGWQARERFERCRELIDAHAADWRSLTEIAGAARLDRSSVCRLFRRFLGISPHQYLLRRKMAAAAVLLSRPGVTVQEAARRVGMDDPFHFSRVFKAIHGVPPSALRVITR